MKEYFIFYTRNLEPLRCLTVEQLGRLFLLIMEYHNEQEPVVPSDLRMAWAFLLQQFRSADEKYERVREKQRENAIKRWSQRDVTLSEAEESDAEENRESDSSTPLPSTSLRSTQDDNSGQNDTSITKITNVIFVITRITKITII